jgi:ribosome maturation factor RimP
LPILKYHVVEIARRSGLFFLESEEMTEILEKMRVLLSPILERQGAFLVDTSIRNERGGKVLQVFVDTDKGITIEECAIISRELAQDLDHGNVIQGAYRLEVSSPGIDRPLQMLRQYRKNVGRRFKVVYQSAESRTTLVGKLQSVEDEKLTFETEKGETIALDFTKIIESKEELPW